MYHCHTMRINTLSIECGQVFGHFLFRNHDASVDDVNSPFLANDLCCLDGCIMHSQKIFSIFSSFLFPTDYIIRCWDLL